MGVVMSFPAALTVVPLHGQILKANASSTPASGTVSFRIEQHLRDTADDVLLAPTTLTATLDDAGEFTISLPATDDPDVTPSGWTYVVHVNTDAIRDTWRISVPAATVGTLELVDIAPAVTPPALVTYLLASTVGQVGGPAGPLDSGGQIPSAQIPGGGGGGPSPSGTVASGTSFGASPSAGAASSYSRGDHAHGSPTAPSAVSVGADVSGAAASAVSTHVAATDPHGDHAYTDAAVATKPGLASTTPAASAVGDAGAIGAGTTAARADHVHGREAFGSVTAQTSYGSSSANGAAATVAHSDHAHGTPSLTSSAATASAVGDSAAAGAAATPARADHTHGREAFGAVSAQTSYGSSSGNGSAATPARSDHTHGTPALTAATPGTSAVADAAAVGVATTPARADHVHGREAFGSVTAQTSYGASSANGAAATLARSDHAHGTPAQDPLILLRNAMVPSGRIETRSRLDSGVTSSTVTSGTLYLIPVWLPIGTVVNSITFVAGNTGFSTLTNQWFTLHDNSRVQLAVTANDGATAWAAQAVKTLGVATVAAGAAASFTTTYAGVHYLGFMVTATTMSNMLGGGAGGAATENAAPAFGACNAGLTTPQAFPFTATAPSSAGPLFYAYVS
jgi:hypothetical protein